MATKKDIRRKRIKRGIRSKIAGTEQTPRLSVFRSNKAIYVQLIDDQAGRTLVSVSSSEVAAGKNATIEVSREVGKKVAEKAIGKGIREVVFDRNGYLYHGQVKALAEGGREGGLKF